MNYINGHNLTTNIMNKLTSKYIKKKKYTKRKKIKKYTKKPKKTKRRK